MRRKFNAQSGTIYSTLMIVSRPCGFYGGCYHTQCAQDSSRSRSDTAKSLKSRMHFRLGRRDMIVWWILLSRQGQALWLSKLQLRKMRNTHGVSKVAFICLGIILRAVVDLAQFLTLAIQTGRTTICCFTVFLRFKANHERRKQAFGCFLSVSFQSFLLISVSMFFLPVSRAIFTKLIDLPKSFVPRHF